MCEYCVLENEDPPCTCVCSSYLGKKYCKICKHRIRVYQMPR